METIAGVETRCPWCGKIAICSPSMDSTEPVETLTGETPIAKETKEERRIRFDKNLLALLAVAVILGFSLWLVGLKESRCLILKDNMASLISGVFSSMLLVSLFVERLVEVLISVSYDDKNTADHKQQIAYFQASKGRFNQDIERLITERQGQPAPKSERLVDIDRLIRFNRKQIEKCSHDISMQEIFLLPNEAKMRKVSTWIGLTIGIFISAIGFRFLSQFLVLDTDFMKTIQYNWFVGADVLLTGAVLSGGSKLVHQIFSVYDSYTEKTKNSFSDKSK